jgi:hypothetical protein
MTCTKCNVENDDANKFCIDCGEKLTAESFWRHLFNWRYYIVPTIAALIVSYSFLQSGFTAHIGGLTPIMAIIMTIQYKASYVRKIGMFVMSIFSISVVMMTVFLTITNFGNKENEAIINDLLSSNKKLPTMLNSEIKYEAITSNDKKSVTQHLKFINYTKEAILSEYQQNIDAFEKDILLTELKNSCSTENIKKILSNGLIFNQIYYDKNNQIIGQIYMDEKRCEPYYKTIKE